MHLVSLNPYPKLRLIHGRFSEMFFLTIRKTYNHNIYLDERVKFILEIYMFDQVKDLQLFYADPNTDSIYLMPSQKCIFRSRNGNLDVVAHCTCYIQSTHIVLVFKATQN